MKGILLEDENMKKLIRFIKMRICKFYEWRMNVNREAATYARTWGGDMEACGERTYRSWLWHDKWVDMKKSLGI